MANLASTAVTILDYYIDGARVGSRRKVVAAQLVLTGQGGATNLIPASLFGLSFIDEVLSFRDSTGGIYLAGPDYARANISIMQRANPVAATYVHLGVNGAGTITLTGIATTDILESVVDLTTPGVKTLSQYTITSANTVTQAAGAGDTSAKNLQFTTRSAPAAAPTDLTATVRCIVVGTE